MMIIILPTDSRWKCLLLYCFSSGRGGRGGARGGHGGRGGGKGKKSLE